MKTINSLLILVVLAIFTVQAGFAQKSIKQTKQQTGFFYTQLNLNGGKLLEKNSKWLFSEVSPYSNINFTYRSKNQRLLQRGYTRSFHLSGYKANFAVVYKSLTDADGQHRPQLGLQMRDLWFKVKTKWDRTSIKMGHFSLPYGHAPKMDLDNSFVPALAGQDLGFNRDLGILFKTPLTQNLDIEVALTMGGSVPTTLVTYDLDPIMNKEVQNKDWNYANFDYQGNWLTSVRIGNPTFNKNEIGIFGAIGKTNGTAATPEQSYVYRLGGDWTYKHKEQFRVTNQIVLGYTATEAATAGYSVYQKSEFDYFLMNKLMLSFSNSLQYQDYTAAASFNGVGVASISYALSPHTRLKLNAYNKYNLTDENHQSGVFLQLVSGFGKRS